MARHGTLWAALLLAVGCGDSGGSAIDAASYKGAWRLAAQTLAGMPQDDAALSGAMTLGDSDFALAIASPPTALLSSYTVASDAKSLTLKDGSRLSLMATAEPRLTLGLASDRQAAFVSDSASPVTTITVQGTITAPSDPSAYAAPRVALVFLSRSDPFFVDDDRLDQALSFQGKTASFRIDLMREALGTERIVYGPPDVAIAIGWVVVYDDRDGKPPGQQRLHELFDACSATTKDCVLGYSPIVLGYRSGTSPQLSASAFVGLREGWSPSLATEDGRRNAPRPLGLVSLDPAKAMKFDVTLWADPASHAVPRLDLTVPTLP
jgi:hypothetical protein